LTSRIHNNSSVKALLL